MKYLFRFTHHAQYINDSKPNNHLSTAKSIFTPYIYILPTLAFLKTTIHSSTARTPHQQLVLAQPALHHIIPAHGRQHMTLPLCKQRPMRHCGLVRATSVGTASPSPSLYTSPQFVLRGGGGGVVSASLRFIVRGRNYN